jgi:hypothetical protein
MPVRGNSWVLSKAAIENKTSTGSAKRMLVCSYLPTVERAPTLSAGRKILVAAKAAHYRQPQSFGDMVLTDRGLTTGVISTPEIAQFALGDLTFKVHTLTQCEGCPPSSG